MLTWRDVRGHVVARHEVAENLDDWVRLAPVDPEGVAVQLRHVAAGGRDRLVVAADIGPASLVSAADAIALNGRLLHGSLLFAHDILTLRRVLTIGWFQGEELDATIAGIRAEGRQLREQLARAGDSNVFNFLAE